MPRRNQELYEERRQQILRGALEVFAVRGFVAATNRDIARAAGINSPGLIYHYFAHKEDLLRAVIETYAPPLQLLAQADALMQMPPEQGLTLCGRAYLGLIDDPGIGACMRVLIGEAIRTPKFAEILREIGPMRFWKLLAAYLQRKMDEGLLRQTHPGVAAQCFIGPLISYLLARIILHSPDFPPIDSATLLTTHIQIFLHGMEPIPDPKKDEKGRVP